MREACRHRLSRPVRLVLCAGGIGAAWAGGVILLGEASDAQAVEAVTVRMSVDAGIDITPPIVDQVTSDLGLPPVPDLPDLPDLSDLPDLPGLDDLPDLPGLPDVPTITVPPIVPQVPVVPQLPIVPVPTVGGPATLVPAPDGAANPTTGDTRAPSPLEPAQAPEPFGGWAWVTPWSFDALPVTPPLAPAPPAPSQLASGSSSVLSPPPADRISSPRTHFASFPEVAPPGRGPPSDIAQSVDTSPD